MAVFKELARRQANGANDGPATDLEHGDGIQAANVGFGRVFSLAKPDAGKLIIGTIALLIASTTSILIVCRSLYCINFAMFERYPGFEFQAPEASHFRYALPVDHREPKYGGTIIDIVSKDIRTPEQQNDALDDVKNTIIAMVSIVVIGERVVARLRKDLFSHLIQQEIAFFDVTRTGELLSRLSEDTQIIKNAATTNLSEALRNLTTALIGVGFMFTSSWKLTLLSLAVVPVISVGIRKFGRFLRELSHETQAAAAASASIAEVYVYCVMYLPQAAAAEFL
ncbi:unnamed protein product [Ilex paraguariensis]|uniref:ABC transmembrane type-1 domain-containing protein n=1 Tax=Ilex paraguariensis TaxID=185542 RepID=A0ABC8STS4_9AQUA